MYFLVYIDDIVLTSSLDTFVATVIEKLGAEFALKDLGALSYFLGIHLTTLENGELLIPQQQYLVMLLQTLGLNNLKPVDTPMEAQLKFQPSEPMDDDEQRRY